MNSIVLYFNYKLICRDFFFFKFNLQAYFILYRNVQKHTSNNNIIIRNVQFATSTSKQMKCMCWALGRL